jgi:hypothetical protein
MKLFFPIVEWCLLSGIEIADHLWLDGSRVYKVSYFDNGLTFSILFNSFVCNAFGFNYELEIVQF